ncbi:MAG TPA: hypothetical protein VFV67_01865 [Actinophytocola sp.]|uniref:hypothetical protein n=1 Tax=Actinophytocola sp. TaxID=1872138 RepID=UPI002DBAE8FF|nr:hypothetical protein [Actinophytocola sp.]HEU5469371.1 hypothetical protein [Actinophytocola sp.]
MTPLEITWTWTDAPTDPDERTATRAELELRIGADPLTLVEDTAGGYRRTVTRSLYPLAEWIARNWWTLVADARPGSCLPQLRKTFAPSIGVTRNPWRVRSDRHAVRAGVGQEHYPDLLIVTEDELTRLNWQRDAEFADATGERFLSSGESLVDSEALAATLSGLVDAVIERLADRGVRSGLPGLWAGVRDADPERAALCRATAWLGLDPHTAEPEVAGTIRSVYERMDKQLAVDFLNAIRPNLVETGLDWVDEARSVAAGVATVAGSESARLADLREHLSTAKPMESGPPHLRGFDLAKHVRAWARLADTEPFDPGFLVRYRTLPMPDPGVVAYVSQAGAAPTVVATRHMPDVSYRFLQARALWHILTEDDDEFLITATHTGRQHAARAFSLELIAPARGIAEHLGSPNELISSEDLSAISMHYVTGDIVVEHQLDNQVLSEGF